MLAVGSVAADAARPSGGATYRGSLVGSLSTISISLHVARSGASVARIAVSHLPFYCRGQAPPASRISFASAPISASGRFSARGADMIGVGPFKGTAAATLTITGTFGVGGRESGVLTTVFAGAARRCSGHSSYRTHS